MNIAVVVDDPGNCALRVPGISTVPARAYLTDPAWRDSRGTQVVNLSRRKGYQRYGYYVSLLAEARGHRALPSAWLLKDLESPRPARLLVAALQRCFDGRPRPHADGFALAILRDPGDRCPASNDAAIAKFEQAARDLGIRTERLGCDDIGRLAEFDGLFIRNNTFIRHYTYRFARRAAELGLTVIDDPLSILRCNNKVFLAELLPRHGIPVPRTLIVDRENIDLVVPSLGLPCVLKRPDSSLSLGVAKIESESGLRATALEMLKESDLIVAQEFVPTPFDWRIGILAGRALFVCKYHMVPGHWQIVRHVPGQHYEEGRTEALPLGAAPAGIVELALKAARLMGDGFYGVDAKEMAPGDLRVIEVNDNPNVDAGNEDGVLRDALYREVMKLFAQRMAAHRERLR